MVVRIRFGRGPKVERKGRNRRSLALAVSALLTPAAVMASALGIWRIAADLRWTSDFAITRGLFSHWQVWIASGILLQFCSHLLSRYARRNDAATS